ncbi:MAG: hypothetical protein PHI47_05890 [Sulfuricurvum sp.]|uniref:hypothetical protein n=1 Tax=Sulfuricurvum sp. TaxID=2025608 RepID=UPI00260DD772|nr:hypothetical protein [Sulfuricurvum sp.]MDD5159562.1 hypothetical protein [Sulfuricurvum sp.]
MTIDVNLHRTDEDFFDNLDEIMEDSMVQMFILHPSTMAELEHSKKVAAEYGSVFYSIPLSLHHEADENCVAFSIQSDEDSALLPVSGKPIMIDESRLNDAAVYDLSSCKGIILNATREHTALSNFHLALGAENIGAFDTDTLSGLSMDQIVLQSSYPLHGFDEISDAVKVISDAMLRPEQSIIARATKSSLELFGFRKS